MSSIKAILFDSGKVLNRPASGHWFITPNFWKYVNKDKFDNIDKDKINMAFREAGNRIDTYNFITDLEEEYKCFTEFFEIFADKLPELELAKSDVINLAKDLVFNTEKYVFLLCRDYEDYLWCKENYKDEGVEIIHSLGEMDL